MAATKLGLLGACVAAAVLAALWWLRDEGGAAIERSGPRSALATESSAAVDLPRAAGAPTPVLPSASPPTDTRASDVELQVQMAERSYARFGGLVVDQLEARGLARVDGERVVRRFFDDNARCLFETLRIEADAQSVAYDSLLDAIQADLHDTDGPLLGAVIDMRAVQSRATPCALAAGQQAGIEPSVLEEAARAALRRAP